MLRPALALLAGAALAGLAACATAPSPAGPTPGGPPLGAPAPTPGYDWIANLDDDGASLAYGVRDSDDVPLMLGCAPGSRRIGVTRPAAADSPTLTLGVGEARLTLPVRSEPSALHDGVYLTGEASSGEPVLQGFRRTGWLWLHEDGEWHGLAGHPGAIPGIERFFQACG